MDLGKECKAYDIPSFVSHFELLLTVGQILQASKIVSNPQIRCLKLPRKPVLEMLS